MPYLRNEVRLANLIAGAGDRRRAGAHGIVGTSAFIRPTGRTFRVISLAYEWALFPTCDPPSYKTITQAVRAAKSVQDPSLPAVPPSLDAQVRASLLWKALARRGSLLYPLECLSSHFTELIFVVDEVCLLHPGGIRGVPIPVRADVLAVGRTPDGKRVPVVINVEQRLERSPDERLRLVCEVLRKHPEQLALLIEAACGVRAEPSPMVQVLIQPTGAPRPSAGQVFVSFTGVPPDLTFALEAT